MDSCIFVKRDSDDSPRSICFLHVDDGQMLSVHPEDWVELTTVLQRKIGPLSMLVPSTGHVAVNTVFFDDGSFNINQNGYILKSLKQVDPEGLLTPVDTPSLPDFFVDDRLAPK